MITARPLASAAAPSTSGAAKGGAARASEPLLLPSETYKTLTVNDRLVVLSADDTPVSLGVDTDLGGDFSRHEGLAVFAESVLIAGSVRGPRFHVAAHALDGVSGTTPVLDARGAPGADQSGAAGVAQAGKDGGDGAAGGTIVVYVEYATDSSAVVHYDARGGAGGAGQTSIEDHGGNGGDGGDGGRVQIYFSDDHVAALAAARGCYNASDAATRRAQAADMLQRLQADPARYANLQDDIGTLSSLVAAGSGADDAALKSVLDALGYGLEGYIESDRTQLLACVDVSGGGYGVYGQGAAGKGSGENGHAGAAGALAVRALDLDDPKSRPTDVLLVHPDQCDMVLAKAKMSYFIGSDDQIRTAVQLAQRLLGRTAFVEDLATDSPIAALYDQHGADYGMLGGVANLRNARDEASAMLEGLLMGKDYYGHEGTYTPLLSESYYQSLLAQELDNLEAIEQSYTTYSAALAKQQATLDEVRKSRERARQSVSDARESLKPLSDMAEQTARSISAYGGVLADKKKALSDEIDEAAAKLKSKLDFNFNDLVGALSMVAFAPNKFMIGLQATSVLYKSITEVQNDEGLDVRKDFLVRGIKACQAEVSALIEGYQQRDDGTLQVDDPGATKLVAERDKLLKLLGDVSGQLGDELARVKSAFDDYTGAVLARNNQVLRYNAIIQTQREKLAAIRTNEARLAALTDEALATMRPDLPALSGFMGGLYHDARDRVLRSLYDASRAYQFWALSTRDLLEESFAGRAPPELTTAVLRGVYSTILAALADALEALRRAPQVFPPKGSGAQGVVISLSSDLVDTLRSEQGVMFQLDTVTPSTTAEDSPLRGWANIRLSKVRIWLDGAKTRGGEVQIAIRQLGEEEVVDPSGAVYAFSHDAISISFRYRLADGTLVEDGDLGADDTADRFAPIGPFAWWSIEVDPAYNDGLDLSGLTAVRMELHGTNYTF